MFHSKFAQALLVCFVLAWGSVGLSQDEEEQRITSRFSLGLGYTTWTEPITATVGNNSSEGVSNYAGLLIYLENLWIKNHFAYGASFGIGEGKASAAGFNPSVVFPDAGGRKWLQLYGEAIALYRIGSTVAVGLGLLAFHRDADWTSSMNPLLTVKDEQKFSYGPEFLMRLTFSNRFTLAQAISSLDFKGATLWRWSTQYTF